MKKIMGKSILLPAGCLLLLCILPIPAVAWPPPCPNPCYYWNGYECYCHEACCIDADCTGECDYCSDSCVCEDDQSLCAGECDYCWAGYCYDDDTKCSGCCECSGGNCVDENSNCGESERCEDCECCTDLFGSCERDEECCSGICGPIGCGNCRSNSDCAECELCFQAICTSILPCPEYTHCDNHECVADCVQNGPMCSYTNPPTDEGCNHAVDSYKCLNAGGACSWHLVEGPDWEANCVVPDCTTFTTYCAKVRPWLCYDKICWMPLPTFCCACDDSNVGEAVARGTREVCPAL